MIPEMLTSNQVINICDISFKIKVFLKIQVFNLILADYGCFSLETNLYINFIL